MTRRVLFALLVVALPTAPSYGEIGFLKDIRAGEEVTVVAIGTSLTHGSLSGATNSWVTPFKAWLESESPSSANLHVFNEAVNGASSQNADPALSGLATQLPAALARNPDVVLIEFSINDAFDRVGYQLTLQQSIDNLNTMIDAFRLQNSDVTIVLQTMNNPAGNPAIARPHIAAYYQAYREVATDRGLLLIDHYPAWVHLCQTDLAQWQAYVPDNLHPTAAGVTAITLPGIQSALLAVPEPGACVLAAMSACGGLLLNQLRCRAA